MELTEGAQQLLALDLLPDKQWSAREQLSCLYGLSREIERHYYPMTIAKRSGGRRKLLVPDQLLKGVQRRILQAVLEQQPVSPYATAYQKGSTIRSNGQLHQGKPMVLKMDVQNFFSSILLPDVLAVSYLRSLLGRVQYVLQIHPGDQEFLQARQQIKLWLDQYGNSSKAIAHPVE